MDTTIHIFSWTEYQVASWLDKNGFSRYSPSFRAHRITGRALLDSTSETLKHLGILNIGDRANILAAIKKLQSQSSYDSQDYLSSPASFQERPWLSAPPDVLQVPYLIPPQVSPHGEPAGYFPPGLPGAGSKGLLIPPRTKSREAFPLGWDSRRTSDPSKAQHRSSWSSDSFVMHAESHEKPVSFVDSPQWMNQSHTTASLQRPVFPTRVDSLLDVNLGNTGYDHTSITVVSPDAGPPLLNESPSLTPSMMNYEYAPDASLSDERPAMRPRENSLNSLKRHPALRERSRSPLPPAEKQPHQRRPHLSISTSVPPYYPPSPKSTSASHNSHSYPSSPANTTSHSPSQYNNGFNELNPTSPGFASDKADSFGRHSPLTPPVPSLSDDSFFEKDLSVDTTLVQNRCIRVTGLNDEMHTIDVGNLPDAHAIRERIFAKFNIRDLQLQKEYGIFGLDFSGQLDTENSLDDQSLLEICNSINSHLKENLILKKFSETRIPPRLSSLELSPQPTSPDSPVVKHRSRRKFRLFGPLSPRSSEVMDETNLPSPTSPLSAPVVSTAIPPLGPPDKDGFSDDSDGNSVDRQPLISRISTKKLEHFFGERPPSELICDNLEEFFPSLTRPSATQVDTTENAGAEKGDDASFLKTFVRETLKRKRASRGTGKHTSFGRRTSRVGIKADVIGKDVQRKPSAAKQDSQNEDRAQEWRDRMSTISEDSSVLTGVADWVPVSQDLSVKDLLPTEGGSDGEADDQERPMASRRRSSRRLTRRQGIIGGVERISPLRGGSMSVDRVWTTSHDKPTNLRRSTVSLRSTLTTKCRRASRRGHGNKTISLSDTELDERASVRRETLKKMDIHVSSWKELVKGGFDVSNEEEGQIGITNTSEESTIAVRKTSGTRLHANLPSAGKEEATYTDTLSDSELHLDAAADTELETTPVPTLPRAFTNEPDKPRKLEWACGPLIGKGTFGKVYYGVNITTGEIMAVKQVELTGLPPRKRNSEEDKNNLRRRMVDALHREITLLKDLDHENIVRYLGYDVEGNTINVFLEYVSGGSIASSIAAMGRFEEPLVRSLTCQILCGLEYLHERTIIHRDIKGGNVLLDENGVAKISDFGISKKNEYKMAYRFNSRMSMQGSVHWMAPEVIKAKGYSAKVDIWSLGCLVLEMFTGSRPWQRLDDLQAMWRLGRGNAPPIPEWLSENARDFLAKCFTIDPDERPTATDLLSHPFADVDPATFIDFRAYREAAIEQKRLEEEAQSLSDDDDWESTVGGESNWLFSRNSLYVARVQSAKRVSTLSRKTSNTSHISREGS